MRIAIISLVYLFYVCVLSVNAFNIYKADTVNCRSGPSTNNSIVRSYTAADSISLTCQTKGQTIFGNPLWDKTKDGCYVSDYYLKTGSSGYVVSECPNNKVPGPLTDDYPYKNKCTGIDRWLYYRCQCTSFVAWRINSRLGLAYHNMYKGFNWGNANSWDNAAKKAGVHVDNNPVPGCIAQTDSGKYGHVAWVAAVSGNNVTIEEYNYVYTEKYSTRVVPKKTFKYIHINV
ncbi:hypothetical protein LPJ73_000558 [Coemansia sp. RSA 2703]|nr:hypothetical protein LPJ73_000558 [Coemansia sp. RSA 2703]